MKLLWSVCHWVTAYIHAYTMIPFTNHKTFETMKLDITVCLMVLQQGPPEIVTVRLACG